MQQEAIEVAWYLGSPFLVQVVEDDEDVRSYSCETLRELGYNVLEAENGQTGLDLLDRHPEVTVLFTDVGLPGGINGRELSERAREMRSTS